MSYACLCLLSRSWYSFTDPGLARRDGRLSRPVEREKLRLEDTVAVLQLHGLRWYGHALLKCENEWVQECMDCEDEYIRGAVRLCAI